MKLRFRKFHFDKPELTDLRKPTKALFPSMKYIKDYIVHYNLDHRWQ